MTIFSKFLAFIIIELTKHYVAKIKRTTVDGAGSGEKEKRLRDKIRKRWEGVK